MTSTLLTDSSGRAATAVTSSSVLLRAVARRVAELLAFLDRRRLELRAHDVAHRLDPVGHDGSTSCRPTAGSAPGRCPRGPRRSPSTGVGEALACRSAPSRASVRFRFSKPQRTCSPVSGCCRTWPSPCGSPRRSIHGVDDAAVVEHLADLVSSGRALALVVDVLDDVGVDLEAGSRGVEGRALVALGPVARRHHVRLAAPTTSCR